MSEIALHIRKFTPKKNIYYICRIDHGSSFEIQCYNTCDEIAEGISRSLGMKAPYPCLTASIVRNIVNKPYLLHKRWKNIKIVKVDKRRIKYLNN